MTPLDQVRALLLAQDQASRAAAREWLAPNFIFHHGFGDLVRDEFPDPITEPFVDVQFLDAFADDQHGAIVFNARDPVTDLCHRCAWVFHHRDGRVSKIFANNQIVPPPS